jgi:Uma2 family endonuclease
MQTQTKPRYYTPEEYLKLEEKAEFRSEYHNGEIIPMTGGSLNHNRIAINLVTALKVALKGKGYEPFINDLRVWLARYSRYVYPDVLVIAGQPTLHENRNDTVTNPLMAVEVLSKSTGNYDQGEKFRYYRSIPELQEYVLIDQYKIHVEQFTKTPEGKWLLTEYESSDAVLTMSSFDFQISLSDIYDGVVFAPVG